jgi:uncharacterized membrane protein (UPF0127 family)
MEFPAGGPGKKNRYRNIITNVLLCSWAFLLWSCAPAISGVGKKTIPVLIKGEILIRAEVASTNEDRSLGLSGRKSLGDQEGMLFVFQDKRPRTFWMNGMNFALDILFIAGGRVVEIVTLPGPVGGEIPSFTSSLGADMVLEINAGLSGRLGIRPGDPVAAGPYERR